MPFPLTDRTTRQSALVLVALLALSSCGLAVAHGQPPDSAEAETAEPPAADVTEAEPDENAEAAEAEPSLDVKEILAAGGSIGWIILALSVAMVALIVEHLLSIRRGTIMPRGLAEQVHHFILQNQFEQAENLCRQHPSFLGRVLSAGLAEVGLGYSAVEKAMEDAAAEQSARLFRKIEYLSVIGTIAPMLGLLGTVWGMILAFMEFEAKANPQVSELAPGIYKALVTTLFGLGVAVPAVAFFAWFRNRIDQFVAEGALLAEHVFADYKRTLAARRKADRQQSRQAS
ncbi:MAG: MotA/TolQ/ExbB proton channel family protein [Planctomycetaceae bacterium]